MLWMQAVEATIWSCGRWAPSYTITPKEPAEVCEDVGLSSACGIYLSRFYSNLKGPGDLSWPTPHTHENDTWVHLHEVWKFSSVTNTKCLRLWPIYTDIISEIFLQRKIFSSKWITLKGNCLKHSIFQIFLFKLIKENWTTSLIRGTGNELGLSSVSGCVTDHLPKAQCSRLHHTPAVLLSPHWPRHCFPSV